ncbi:hypothetical protein SAMN05421780_104167 [Flexibacter flexilis DSM 6793]|uniref:Uncharacterized protein n=2 Tax=Flexibacter flexilis TaxID=998 RepID=A0A1I1I2D8_9BACT|nr:hypothetical protein SAMN05421780_104167 [Flexibacter flexilis DSM 6793]
MLTTQVRTDMNLDQSLEALVEKKMQLNSMKYNDANYDKVEDELHELEDDFIDEFGDLLEEALQDVHDEFCSDNDVLLPTAYLAQRYTRTKDANGKNVYEVDFKDGVQVDVDEYPGKDSRLVLVPNPTRVMLTVNGISKEVVWQAETK